MHKHVSHNMIDDMADFVVKGWQDELESLGKSLQRLRYLDGGTENSQLVEAESLLSGLVPLVKDLKLRLQRHN